MSRHNFWCALSALSPGPFERRLVFEAGFDPVTSSLSLLSVSFTKKLGSPTLPRELGDQTPSLGRLVLVKCAMFNADVVLDIIKYEPVKVGSNLYERTAKRFPVYVN